MKRVVLLVVAFVFALSMTAVAASHDKAADKVTAKAVAAEKVRIKPAAEKVVAANRSTG